MLQKSRFYFLLILFLLTVKINAQQLVGKVVDAANSLELSDVVFTSKEYSTKYISTKNGEIKLPKTGIYSINKIGYITQEISLISTNYFVVSLKPTFETLSEIEIKALNFKHKLNEIPASIALIQKKEIAVNSTNVAQVINKIPGIYMHSGTYTTNRITIRGIGSRNLYGTSKIKVYYDDIPLTNGSGESSIEDIELTSLGSVQILKGSSATLFGSGLGGAIQFVPERGFFSEQTLNTALTIGSFGLKKYVLQTELGNNTNSANLIYSNFHSDGYRDNNITDKESITIASKHFFNSKNSFSFFGNYINLKGFIPSSIDEENYLNNPTSAAFTWNNAKGYEASKKGMIGASWKHTFNDSTNQSTNIFYSNFDTYEARPFNILKEQTAGFGIRTRLNSLSKIFNSSFNWVIGGEFFKDSKSYGTFENLYKNASENSGSIEGERLSKWKENRTYFNLFFDSKYNLSNSTQLNIGVNLNNTYYKLFDKFNSGFENSSGSYNFKTKLSPSFGITQQINENSMLYGSINHGFSAPTLEEILLPNNEINSTIKPEEGWNYEIGSRGKLINSTLNYSVSIFYMNVKNLLVAKRIGDDQYVGVNAGKTSYKGFEFSLNYNIFKNNTLKIYNQHNVSINNFKFNDFIDFENDYSGNYLPGIPKFTYNTSINLETIFGLYTNLDFNYFGKMPLRDDNILYSKKYQLVNALIGYNINISKRLSSNIFIKFNNVFNEKYASMLLINATSFGNSKPRYYYPGEPTNFIGNINLKYTFN